jgi:hypothetical protein
MPLVNNGRDGVCAVLPTPIPAMSTLDRNQNVNPYNLVTLTATQRKPQRTAVLLNTFYTHAAENTGAAATRSTVSRLTAFLKKLVEI